MGVNASFYDECMKRAIKGGTFELLKRDLHRYSSACNVNIT